MVGIVEADADELADPCNARADARAAGNERQALRIGLRQRLQRVGMQVLARDVGDHAGKIADRAGGVDQARLLGTGGPVTDKLHDWSPNENDQ